MSNSQRSLNEIKAKPQKDLCRVNEYSGLSNKRAAQFINILKNSNLQGLIPSSTFIDFEKFARNLVFHSTILLKIPTCTALFHPAYLKRKLFYRLFESRFETGRIFAMEHSRQVLVQVMLFQFLGPGLSQDGATSNFSPDSKSSLSGLSNEVLFVSGFFRKRTVKMFS